MTEQAFAAYHPAPHSYTGEDVVEIGCHGNPLIVKHLLKAIHLSGLARMAERGEFTRRAYLNGKIDLAQAEAVAALIDARSVAGVEMAAKLLGGALSGELNDLSARLQDLLTSIEAAFVLDEAELDGNTLKQDLRTIIEQLKAYCGDASRAGRMFDGVVTTIAGRPNAGKSSLLNALLGYDRAIVHAEAGTTRDVIRETLSIDGLDFIFHDTAGIRAVEAGAESLGIARTFKAMNEADLILYVVDASRGLEPAEMELRPQGPDVILVYNKSDLGGPAPAASQAYPAVQLSALRGTGIAELKQAMRKVYPADLPRIFLERHTLLASQAVAALEQALAALETGLTPDVITLDLDSAAASLKEITGSNACSDKLDEIFARFCVGK